MLAGSQELAAANQHLTADTDGLNQNHLDMAQLSVLSSESPRSSASRAAAASTSSHTSSSPAAPTAASTASSISPRLQTYNQLAAPTTTTRRRARSMRLPGSLGHNMDRADMLDYKRVLSQLLTEPDGAKDSAAALSSAPNTPVTTTTAASTASSAAPATPAAASTTTISDFSSTTSKSACIPSPTSAFASSPLASTTTCGPSFPVKGTCHVPAPYVPLACYILAAASKGALPHKLPYVGSMAQHLSVAVCA